MGAGRKVWTTETLSSTEVQEYLQDQVVMVFPSAAVRDVEIPNPTPGMTVYLEDSGTWHGFDDGAWRYLMGGRLGALITSAAVAGIVTEAGWVVQAVGVQKLRNGMGSVSVVFTRTGAAIVAPADGNIATTPVASIPKWAPNGYVPTLNANVGPITIGALEATGQIRLHAVGPGASVPTNSSWQFATPPYQLADPLGV